jgi:CheY-like chemotaxis protein
MPTLIAAHAFERKGLGVDTSRRRREQLLLGRLVHGQTLALGAAIDRLSNVTDHEALVMNEGAYRVLLVEDDVMLRESLSILLADDFRIESCASGEQALHLLAERRFHVVCTDFHMPGMNGLELFRAVSARVDQPAPHFVVLTGDAKEVWDTVPEAERRSLSVLRKPCSPALIIDQIKRIAGKAPAIEP